MGVSKKMAKQSKQGHKVPWWEILMIVLVVLALLGVIAWVLLAIVFKKPKPTVCIQKGYPSGSYGWDSQSVVKTVTASSPDDCLNQCTTNETSRMAFHAFEKTNNCECFGEESGAWPPKHVLFSSTDASFGQKLKNRRFHPQAKLACDKKCDDCGDSNTCIGTLI